MFLSHLFLSEFSDLPDGICIDMPLASSHATRKGPPPLYSWMAHLLVTFSAFEYRLVINGLMFLQMYSNVSKYA